MYAYNIMYISSKRALNSYKNMYKNIYSSFIYYNQKLNSKYPPMREWQ